MAVELHVILRGSLILTVWRMEALDVLVPERTGYARYELVDSTLLENPVSAGLVHNPERDDRLAARRFLPALAPFSAIRGALERETR